MLLALCANVAAAAVRPVQAHTGPATSITATAATVHGTIIANGPTSYAFSFGSGQRFDRHTRWQRVRTAMRVRAVARLSGLVPGVTYAYRLMTAACQHCRRTLSTNRAFSTVRLPLPQVQTDAASVTGPTTATLSGGVDPEGSATSYYFEYGLTAEYGTNTPEQPVGPGQSEITASDGVSGLAATTVYHYRLVATSRAGVSYGEDQTLMTPGYYQNPVYAAAAMPDPFVLDVGAEHGDYWAFGTGDLFPVLHSTDLVNWSAEGTAMATRPAWVVSSGDWHPWAPSVIYSGDPCPGALSGGCYIMYYVGLSAQLNVNCVGVATSSAPGGPYTDQGPLALDSVDDVDDSGGMPIGCGDDAGRGNIDPSPFIDASGQAYLYVSTDLSCNGGSCALAPTISVIPLAPDLLQASGPRVALLSGQAGGWEAAGVLAPTVEGPFMELHDGTYYLFYSGGSYEGAYGMGYATGSSPTGPFTPSAATPIFSQTTSVFGPGGGDDLVTGPHGGLWLVYAARTPAPGAVRTLWLDSFSWQPSASPGAPDVPEINGPTSTPQATAP